jgi:hypothetical protein
MAQTIFAQTLGDYTKNSKELANNNSYQAMEKTYFARLCRVTDTTERTEKFDSQVNISGAEIVDE